VREIVNNNFFASLQVKHLIELRIKLYMTPKEIVNKIQNEAKIDPVFTKTGNEVFFLCVLSLLFFPTFTWP
jgi:uncharacterized protein (TIGR01589 family)